MTVPPLAKLVRVLGEFLHQVTYGGIAIGPRVVAPKTGENARCLGLPVGNDPAQLKVGEQHPEQIAIFGWLTVEAKYPRRCVIPCQHVPAQVQHITGACRQVVHQALHQRRHLTPGLARLDRRALVSQQEQMAPLRRVQLQRSRQVVEKGRRHADLAPLLQPGVPGHSHSRERRDFIAPLISAHGERSVTPYLWVWGVGGVLGSFLIGTLVDRFSGPRLTFAIMLLLGIALIALPLLLGISPWLALIPIALWGAVGWALQVPQNNELMKARELQGDGNLALALNESALYLGSAIGASVGRLALAVQVPVDMLSVGAGVLALLGMGAQVWLIRQTNARGIACNCL